MTNLSLPTPTMSSLEIAKLVESRHDNVKTSIDRLAAQGVIKLPATEEVPTGKRGPRAIVYVFSGSQGRRDSIVVVAQLSPEFTARLVDRWQELEAQVAAPTINTLQALSDPATLLTILQGYAERAIVDDREKRALEHQVEDLTPKAALIERITASPEALTFTQAAKVLGVTIRRLTTWLHEHGWVYRQNGSWVGYQKHIESGDLEYKEAHYTDAKTGLACIKPYCHITQRGMLKIAQQLAQEDV